MISSLQFLSGGGEMGGLIRAYDWESSSIGPADKWPQSLRTTLGILLHSKFPMFLYWGPDLVCFYNDAYRFSLGNDGKHPFLLGMKGEEAWPETWHIVKPPIDKVLNGGEATWSEDQLVPIYREGAMNDAYWTFSFSPVKNESNDTAGVFLTLIETTEKVNNLKKLIEANDQLAFAIEATELGTFDLNPLTNKFIGNNRLKDWFGLPQEMEVDLPLAIHVMVEKDRSRVADAIQKTLQYESGGLYDIEYSILNPVTKLERMVRAKGRAWFGDDKKAFRFNGTLQDITEQVIARRKIEESEHRFRNLIMQAPVLITTFEGPSFKVGTMNEKALEIWGKSYEEVINKPLFEVSPETEAGLETIFSNIYATGELFIANEYLVQLKRPGRPDSAYFNSVYQPLRDSNGEVYGIISIGTEVTESVNARKQIETSEKRFSNILSQSLMAIAIFKGPDMIVEFANSPMLNGMGKGNDILNKPLVEGVPELKDQVFPQLLADVFTTGVAYEAFETKAILVRNGMPVETYFNFVYQPYRDVDNSVTGVTALATEVTELVLAKKQMEASEKRFSNILSQSLMAIAIFKGPDMVVAYANKPMLNVLGKGNAVLNKPLLEGVPELKDQVFPQLLADVYTTGVAFEGFETKAVLVRNGIPVDAYFNFVYQPYRDVDDTITGITVLASEVTIQVLAKKQTEESEKRITNILSQSIMSIGILKGANMVVTLVNEPLLKIWGKTQDIVGKPLFEVMPELASQEFPKQLNDVFTSGIPYTFNENRAILMNNGVAEERFFSVVIQPYTEVDHTITGVTVIGTEVTDYVRAKKQIEENAAVQKKLASQLKLATDSANIGIWSLDIASSKLEWSDTHKMMWGYNAPFEDVTYEDWHQAIVPEDKELAFQKIAASKTNRSIYDVEYKIHKADDHVIRSIRSVGKYYYNDEGEAETLTGISIDITEQKQAQEKITESESQFRIFADSIQNLAWIANADGWIYFYNQQWYDYTGTTINEMEGSGWQKVHHPDKVEEVSAFLKEAWKKDEAFELNCRLRQADGAYRWFLTRGYPVKDAYGNIERWIGTNIDIHEQKTKEHQKDDFISIASHEMKTPLTTAKGYLELLMMLLSEEDKTAFLYANKANHAVERLHSLITELLDASKIQNGKLDYNLTMFDFNEMVDEAIENIQLTAKNHSLQKNGTSVSSIKGDKNRLQQVMINILSNAVKYSPKADKVHIKVEEQYGNIQVSVQDFGIGMSGQHLDKVFDRYYRVQEHAVHFQGLGIGLYISSNIIQRHEGKMWVESEPGKGSTFYFTLPL
ncbi:MAG: PAS domain S-box protein [Chitinophagaceae bacterium]